MRSVKTGSVSFGLVSVSCKLYAATEDHDVKTHQLHDKDGGRIRYKKVCEDCGETVEFSDLIKGVPHGEKMVHVTDEDLKSLDEEQGSNFDVVSFIDSSEIDPISYEKTYYLSPEKGAEESYALLKQVLIDTDKFGVVKFAMRQKTRMAVLRVYGNVLALHTILWHDEVRSTAPLVGADKASKIELNPKMVALGHALVESMTEAWDPTQFTDTYTERLADLVEAKANGEEFVAAEPDEDVSEIADLLAKLEASVMVSSKAKKDKPAKKLKRAS